ncbi:MAG: class I SAM-dependent methyltransferase [Candidatus Methanomethylophilaceae archaeon]|nr:class I SAM-dependent methyltransferase [Candidatus Methanomethylophilaceae archaeon]
MTDGIPDTLYIPLESRIYSTKVFPEYFMDSTSLRFRDIIPQSIIDNSSEYSLLASVARYYNTDRMERDFVRRNGKSSIVHLGVGLETANYRLSSLNAHFYSMDLPEIIELRKRLLPKADNETFIAGDLFDMQWAGSIPNDRSVMILALGVFQYFRETEIIGAIGRMKEIFPGAELVFDATNMKGLNYTNRYVRKTGNKSAAMYFGVDDAKDFAERSGTELLECIPFFTDARKKLWRKTHLITRISMAWADRFGMAKILRLKL